MKFSAILGLLILLAACEPQVSPDSRPAAPAKVRRTDDLSPSATELLRHPLVCGDHACPPGVGVFTALTDAGFVTCTGFLAGERTFVTNRHCLPEALKVRGTTCRGKAAVAFLDQGQTKMVDCKSVLDLSPRERSGDPDFAYLELDHSRPGTMHVARGGVADRQDLVTWTITRVDGQNLITRRPCRSLLNSPLNPAATTPFSAVLTAVGCELKPGNSGGPVLNARGDVVGLLQVPNARPEVKAPPHASFLNFACVSNPTNGAGPHPNCSRASQSTVADCAVDEIATDVARGRLTDEIVRGLPRIFRYVVAYDEFRRAIVAEPKCVVTSIQDVDAWLKYVKLPAWFGFKQIDVTYDGAIKMIDHVEVDADWRFKSTRTFSRGEAWPQRLRLREWYGWRGVITRSGADGRDTNLDVIIRTCAGGEEDQTNDRVYRTTDGREMSQDEWRRNLVRARATRCPGAGAF